MEDSVVIVGAGQGGFQVAASLRDEGYAGSITLIGDEDGLPYQRPPLSKGLLSGQTEAPALALRPAAFYAERGIDYRAGARVTAIDRAASCVRLVDGRDLAYRHLVLATGARARMPDLPGVRLDGVWPLRTQADALSLRSAMSQARRVVIVGAGFIGLEVAVIAQAQGLEVDVLELGDRPLQRAVSSLTADVLQQALQQRGVRFHFGIGVQAFLGDSGRVRAVLTSASPTQAAQEMPADLVVIGIGVVANDELAAQAGLSVREGVQVDAQLLTADPAISAIGDCARFPMAGESAAIRLESVQNAVDQARCVASRIAGRPAPYRKVPWFWSDQGANRLQIAGLARPDDVAVLRGDVSQGRFSVLRLREGLLTAVESINHPADHMAARKLLAAPLHLTPTQAADARVKLAELAPTA